jgi:hypothetical protein
MHQADGDLVVTVGEGIGLHRERVTHDALHVEPSTIDVGQNLVDGYATPSLEGQLVRRDVVAASAEVSSDMSPPVRSGRGMVHATENEDSLS